MKVLEKRPYLFVVVLIFIYGIYVLSMRLLRTKQIKEGFNESPLKEISQIIKGGGDVPVGSDIKSVIQRYQSTSGSQQFDPIISEIDDVSNEIVNIKKECDNDKCDNISDEKVKNIIDRLKKMIASIEILITTSNMSTPDRELIKENLEKIKRLG